MKKNKVSLVVLIIIAIIAVYFLKPELFANYIKSPNDNNAPAVTTVASEPLSEGELRIHFIDVAQGDSIVIELPDKKKMIIDGGKDRFYDDKLYPYIEKQGWKKFDYVMLTHSDEDHCGGLDDVIKDYDCIDFLAPETTTKNHTTKSYKRFVDYMNNEVTANNGSISYTIEGMEIEGDGYRFDVYSPTRNLYDSLPEDEWDSHEKNSVSPIMVLTFDGRKIMFTGDTNFDNENPFVEKYSDDPNLDIDVLKVAHHGSREATSKAFLDLTKPEFGVIEVGLDENKYSNAKSGNTYGHPHDESIDRLKDANVELYRTNINGSVVLTLNAKGDGDASMNFAVEK